MQPDNARPAASSPRITFSDDMAHFQSKIRRPQQQCCALNATIPLSAVSAKTGPYASVCTFVSRCGSAAVAFMPQLLRLPVDFWAGGTPRPKCGRAGATSLHKYGPAVNPQVMKRLPESGLVPLVLVAFSGEAGTGPRPETRLDVRLPHSSGVAHVFGVCSLRILVEEGSRRGSGGSAGECGLDRPVEPDAGGGPRGRAAGRDRGADPGGHAANRDFQPAL